MAISFFSLIPSLKNVFNKKLTLQIDSAASTSSHENYTKMLASFGLWW